MTTSPYLGLSEDLVAEIETVLRMVPQGLHASAQFGDGIVFAGTRDFEDGDNLKHVDISRSFERSPKLDDLVVRRFEPDRQIKVVIVLDCTLGMEIPKRKFRMALAVAWLFALSAFRRRDTVMLYCAFDATEGGLRYSSECRSVEDLNVFFENVRTGDAKDFADPNANFFDAIGQRIPEDTFMVVISDFERQKFFRHSLVDDIPARRDCRLLLALLDVWEGVAPAATLVALRDPVSGKKIEVDAREGKELMQMAKATQRTRAVLGEGAEISGHIAARIPIFSDSPFDELLQKIASGHS